MAAISPAIEDLFITTTIEEEDSTMPTISRAALVSTTITMVAIDAAMALCISITAVHRTSTISDRSPTTTIRATNRMATFEVPTTFIATTISTTIVAAMTILRRIDLMPATTLDTHVSIIAIDSSGDLNRLEIAALKDEMRGGRIETAANRAATKGDRLARLAELKEDLRETRGIGTTAPTLPRGIDYELNRMEISVSLDVHYSVSIV